MRCNTKRRRSSRPNSRRDRRRSPGAHFLALRGLNAVSWRSANSPGYSRPDWRITQSSRLAEDGGLLAKPRCARLLSVDRSGRNRLYGHGTLFPQGYPPVGTTVLSASRDDCIPGSSPSARTLHSVRGAQGSVRPGSAFDRGGCSGAWIGAAWCYTAPQDKTRTIRTAITGNGARSIVRYC